VADDDFLYLTTTGRVSGQPHEIEIWYARRGGDLYLLAGGGRSSDWVANLAVSPACTVRLGRRDASARAATARLLDAAAPGAVDPAEEATARRLVFEKYEPGRGGLSSWRDRSLPVVLTLA
jgi:deazaflavin-dependent oxidoreductase (nitroreductase family)